MVKKQVGKLVRDRIPALIQQSGKTCTTEVLSPEAYRAALHTKLLEEAHEVIEEGADVATELADLCEVIDAIIQLHNLDWSTIQTIQTQRRTERGGFQQRLWLETVEEPTDV